MLKGKFFKSSSSSAEPETEAKDPREEALKKLELAKLRAQKLLNNSDFKELRATTVSAIISNVEGLIAYAEDDPVKYAIRVRGTMAQLAVLLSIVKSVKSKTLAEILKEHFQEK